MKSCTSDGADCRLHVLQIHKDSNTHSSCLPVRGDELPTCYIASEVRFLSWLPKVVTNDGYAEGDRGGYEGGRYFGEEELGEQEKEVDNFQKCRRNKMRKNARIC